MQSYDNMRGYFENTLADSITNRKKFRAGLSIHDISRPAEMKEIAFLEMPGFGINRLWWPGGRYAYVSAHFDGFTDHILCIVDLKDITKPEIVSRWWLPGMNRAGGETSTVPQGRRVALHHMITAGDRGYAAWRDGGFTIHDISDPTKPRLLSHINWSPPFPGGTHTATAAGPRPGRRGRRSERRTMRQGHVSHLRPGCARAGESGADLHVAHAKGTGTSARWALSVRTTCTRTGPVPSAARKRSSRPTTMPACACSISRTHSRRRKSPPGCHRLRSG